MFWTYVLTAIGFGASGAIGGYVLHAYIHSVADTVAHAVSRAFLTHTGVVAVDTTAAKIGAEAANAIQGR